MNVSSPLYTACCFRANQAPEAGGAISNTDFTSFTATGCLFEDNSANGGQFPNGGAVFNVDGVSATLSVCVFVGNVAAGGGGAIMNVSAGEVVLLGCTFESNAAPGLGSGGAINSGDTVLVVSNCTFRGNGANSLAGALSISSYEPSEAVVSGCVFDGNAATTGGAVYIGNYTASTFTNCTLHGNFALEGAAVFRAGSSGAALTNCILWGNPGPAISGAPTLSYSCVQGRFPGPGNIQDDPLFANPGNGDFRVLAGSPCIDAGSNAAVPDGVVVDLDGNPRFVDDPCLEDSGAGGPPVVDMGPHEFQGSTCDLDGDGVVGVIDLLLLLVSWGPCGDCSAPSGCPSDFDSDCMVDVRDLLALLGSWS